LRAFVSMALDQVMQWHDGQGSHTCYLMFWVVRVKCSKVLVFCDLAIIVTDVVI
jgi:hypothetical protein